MSRCLSCSQENCGYRSNCTCWCHADENAPAKGSNVPVTTKFTLSPDLQVDILQHLDAITKARRYLESMEDKLGLLFPGMTVEVEVRVGKGEEK